MAWTSRSVQPELVAEIPGIVGDGAEQPGLLLDDDEFARDPALDVGRGRPPMSEAHVMLDEVAVCHVPDDRPPVMG
ncbi:hypothetical protein ACF059_07805 [Streptomyces sp. NPDC016562]|uniref:hypothetical protein n=1 Tax=Streptomyces sp. NPDC016562 TaxID=3364966 RepID=UPI0036FF7EC9